MFALAVQAGYAGRDEKSAHTCQGMSEDHGVESEGAGEAARAAAGTTSQEQSLPPQQEQPLQKEQQQEQEQEEQQQEESARSMLNAKRGAKISFPKPTSQRMSDSMWNGKSHAFMLRRWRCGAQSWRFHGSQCPAVHICRCACEGDRQ